MFKLKLWKIFSKNLIKLFKIRSYRYHNIDVFCKPHICFDCKRNVLSCLKIFFANIIVNKFGLEFDLKLVDLLSAKESKHESRKFDIVTLIQVFHEALGGSKHYAKHPDAIKYICCGLKTSLILKKFKTAGQLRRHLESMCW